MNEETTIYLIKWKPFILISRMRTCHLKSHHPLLPSTPRFGCQVRCFKAYSYPWKSSTNFCHLWWVLTLGLLSAILKKLEYNLSEPFFLPGKHEGFLLQWERGLLSIWEVLSVALNFTINFRVRYLTLSGFSSKASLASLVSSSPHSLLHQAYIENMAPIWIMAVTEEEIQRPDLNTRSTSYSLSRIQLIMQHWKRIYKSTSLSNPLSCWLHLNSLLWEPSPVRHLENLFWSTYHDLFVENA